MIKTISGDLISIGFNKKDAPGEKIVVIPVDTGFTLKVDSSSREPLISKDSIHGKWIIRMKKAGHGTKWIKSHISYIGQNGIGKIGIIKTRDSIFYLVALSELGDRNKASSSEENVKKCLESVIKEYDFGSQGIPLYLPLMGTGRSRAGLTPKKSLELIESFLLEKRGQIHGEINIVVYRKDLDKVDANYGL